MFPHNNQRCDRHEVRERIIACRKRLQRRRRANQKAVAVMANDAEADEADPPTVGFDGARAPEDAKTVLGASDQSGGRMEHLAESEVDRRPGPRARFSTEEEIIRA
jgi:hypothetical protein